MEMIGTHSKVFLKATRFVAGVLAASFMMPVLAQVKPQEKPSDQEDEVVRIDTNLVQVDAVVTDAKGRHITDLRAEEFEILEDGRPQQVTNFSYIKTADSPAADDKKPSSADKKDIAPLPPTVINRDQVRRTIVLAVDDMGISFAELNFVRSALNHFIDQQMQAGDLVAIATTSGDMSRLTTDKQILRAALTRLRWQAVRNRVGIHGLEAQTDIKPLIFPPVEASLYHSLGALDYIVAGLKDLPGRKSVLFFTEDLPIIECNFGAAGSGLDPTAQKLVEKLLRSSNAASVVIHTIDAHGLATVNPSAADMNPKADSSRGKPQAEINQNPTPLNSAEWITSLMNRRMNKLCSTQQSLQHLAHQTGGLAIVNSNDLSGGVDRILNDLSGYYLIGYRPSADTFKKKNGRATYHHITIRVKRPGLTSRSREGFLGEIEKPPDVASRPMEQQLINAINSPFSHAGVRLRLVGLFGTGQSGTFIRVLIHVDPRDLTFIEKGDGWREAVINVLANSDGPEGSVTDHISRSDTVRARGATFARLMRNGLDYDMLIRVKKAGAYHLRAAVRDSATARIGTTTGFVEVPNLKQGAMAISGILLSDAGKALDFSSTLWRTLVLPAASLKISNGVGDSPDMQPTPAVRRFRVGMTLDYRYFIYNARVGRERVLPNLRAEVRLFRDGKLIASQQDVPLEDVDLQLDPRYLAARGEFPLKADLEPGQYVLQITITNELTDRPLVTASQSIDFEIVK